MRKCLSADEVAYKARGHELWNVGEEHLKECLTCSDRVAEASRQFILQEASQSPDPSSRPNKMGRSHPRYVKAILTT